MNKQIPKFNYDPEKLERELKRHYISASEEDISEMLKELNLTSLDQLYSDLPEDVKINKKLNLPEALKYQDLADHLNHISEKNSQYLSFIGDGLAHYKVPELVPFVASLRGLTTAYTPYQPERSQGSLESLWIYSSSLSMLTGFEAINASLYDRSTCLFEALNCSLRIVRNSDTVIVCQSIYPGDMDVIQTLGKDTNLKIVIAPIDSKSGLTDYKALHQLVAETTNLASIAFPQVNSFGNLEDVDLITDLCNSKKIQAIAIIDPMLLATGGLKAPVNFGTTGEGASMIVGEGQHLAIAPNFGGPGLGIFGIRFNDKNKNAIRSTAGRYIGNALDINGRVCKSMVLATREQHIRREKATSNICSNQSFIATLAGAGILSRGENGMRDSIKQARENAEYAVTKLTSYKGVDLKFADSLFFNEFTIVIPKNVKDFIKDASANSINVGVDISNRLNNEENLLLISLTDIQTKEDIDRLDSFFAKHFEKDVTGNKVKEIDAKYLRTSAVGLPNHSQEELRSFYQQLGEQNVSPDNMLYPLGSCTMKYNPYINDWAADLPGFSNAHPQAPVDDIQGSLQIGYEIQEIFKKITGLAAVTTQPLAGAQGELAGIKMFQAYHRDRGEGEQRNVILIPRSAHGTNPATASMAGFETKVIDGQKVGIVLIEADATGRMNWQQLEEVVSEYSNRISGIMVTNPNTSGIFEIRFKEMADLIHSVGGLVYMDGANMNAIAGWVDLEKLGVDAVHNNLHKTWSISHGGGGPGSAIVAVSSKLVDFLPGDQVVKVGEHYDIQKPKKGIGQFHRHFGNFAHNIRAYAYLRALGDEGLKRMSGVAVLSAKYLFKKLKDIYPTLPAETESVPRMHEFILTITPDVFNKIESAGVNKSTAIARIGKLFLDFGLHAPTVAFPEVYGLMVEPTESFTKKELDRFVDVLKGINFLINEHPEVLNTVPHFTPIDRVDEVTANKNLSFAEKLGERLPVVAKNRIEPAALAKMSVEEICQKILQAHGEK